MSNKELDNLFNSKLVDLKKEPSASAWDKIQAQTDKKKAVWPWVRIAAAILLLFTIGATVWITTYLPENNMNLAESTVNKPIEKKRDEMPEVEKDIKPVAPAKQKAQQKDTKKAELPLKEKDKPARKIEAAEAEGEQFIVKQEVAKKSLEEDIKALPTVDNLEIENKVAINKLPDATIEDVKASTEQEQEVSGKTIEINLDDFTKTSIAQNEKKVEEDKKTEEKGLGKVLSLMKEIKSEAGIGDLRAAKNEILAFNFKKQQNEDSK